MSELPPEDRMHIQEQMKGVSALQMVLLFLFLGLPCAAVFDACVKKLTHSFTQTDPTPTP